MSLVYKYRDFIFILVIVGLIIFNFKSCGDNKPKELKKEADKIIKKNEDSVKVIDKKIIDYQKVIEAKDKKIDSLNDAKRPIIYEIKRNDEKINRILSTPIISDSALYWQLSNHDKAQN